MKDESVAMECEAARRDWFFPDAYLPDISDYVSHEALCVLNVGEAEAGLEMRLYFEDGEPMTGFYAVCGAMRTNHIRIDKLQSRTGETVPQCRPYAIWLHSDSPVLCQYTRVDAGKPARALMTTMGL